MSKLALYLDVGGVKQRLDIIEHRLDDPTDLMKDVLLLAIRSVALNFESQGRPQRWADLAESTERARFRRASKGKRARSMGSLAVLGSMQILRVTGLLTQSWGEGQRGPFSAGGGHGESDRTTMTLATSNPGAWNQFPNLRTGAPARVMAIWQDVDREDVLAMASDFVLARNVYAI